MDPTNIGLFRLAERRLQWVDARQRLLAQDVANANTPGWQPRDLAPFLSASGAPGLASTSERHMSATNRQVGEQRPRPAGRSPSGNGISIEDMLGRVADTTAMQELTLNLHRRYVGMFRTALGRVG